MNTHYVPKTVLITGFAVLLAGCGSSDSGGPERAATLAVKSGSAADSTYTYEPGASPRPRIARGQSGSISFYYLETITGMPADFNSYKFPGANPFYILRGLTPTEDGEVFVQVGGTHLERLGETVLPDSGTATYTGSYAGLYNTVGSAQTAGHMFGDATLEVDFQNDTTSGRIRSRANSGGTAATDIVFDLGALEGGSFEGTTTGGAFASGYTSAPGSYGGLIVGADGQEAIGQVTVYHNGPTNYVETGGFVVAE